MSNLNLRLRYKTESILKGSDNSEWLAVQLKLLLSSILDGCIVYTSGPLSVVAKSLSFFESCRLGKGCPPTLLQVMFICSSSLPFMYCWTTLSKKTLVGGTKIENEKK